MTELVKLKILVEDSYPNFDVINPIEALFNPNQIDISKVGWRQGVNGPVPADDPAVLSVALFFDTSLPAPAIAGLGSTLATAALGRSSLLPSVGLFGRSPDVRRHTSRIYHLTEKKGGLGGKLRPPICRLVWGLRDAVLFQGVLRQVSKSFTRFLPSGVPIRATLTCEFEEWLPPEMRQKAQNPIDDPTRLVRRGETLSSIAAEEYNDPRLWRVIAEANQMDNPLALIPGQRITVPPLRL
ncbi:LysM peptidoglycan-binding domain-containing protein [Myxacorys almedinensis]|uniref:LysM peptidoglycan-binding domain-containing protein n=1 Tax=Myxacorys almedinensis A TaxID=2690445 RepID=A0A8J7YZX4_9CYAN|nr:LysM peptidoglycan-binding domain-containing protein [Myxacorys almedinensis]NDJ16465.1 LysM peptidoglycan-binding domain-containing protein [Myxacorys almedinensis A]